MEKEIYFATNNKNKINEINELIRINNIQLKIITLLDLGIDVDIEETGSTLEENAYVKAKYMYDIVRKPVISEDSGLFIKSLNNEPGVYSARYAGNHDDKKNNELVLSNLLLAKDNNREAYYKTVFCYIDFGGKIEYSEGLLYGIISDKEIGFNGFGYDSIFIPVNNNDEKLTLAELNEDFKIKNSHRTLAIKDFLFKKIMI